MLYGIRADMWAIKAGKGFYWRGTVVKVLCSVSVDLINRRVCLPALVKCHLCPVAPLLEIELVSASNCSSPRLKHNFFDGTLRERQQISVIGASTVIELHSDGRQETASHPGVWASAGGSQQLDRYRTSYTGSVHLFFMLYLLNI